MNYDFHSLLQLPLFLGMGRSELADIEQEVSIGSAHSRRGAILASENEACTALVLVAKGTVLASTRSDDHSYEIVETLQAPLLIQPYLWHQATLYRHVQGKYLLRGDKD